MFDKLSKTAAEFSMFDNAENVIVALSGGADSMSLLNCLYENRDFFGIKVSAAHVNHCLRGAESERDMTFVEEYCKKLQIPLIIKKVDIAALSLERKIGCEECGRQERYRFFEEISDSPNTVVATAHTASDNAETVLLNITRGTGLDGICGIPPVRGNIVRPLLGCSRSDIEEYCRSKNIPYVTDSTNLEDEYNRNKIRHTVLPALANINPSVEAAVNRLSRIAMSSVSYINDKAAGEYDRCVSGGGLVVSRLLECDDNLLSYVLRYAVNKEFDITAELRHIELLKKMLYDGRGAVELRKGLTAKIQNGILIFEKKENNTQEFEETLLKLDNKFVYNNKTYTISPKFYSLTDSREKINKKLLNSYINCGIISCDTVVRNRKNGDTFKPVGRNCTKTLKKLFNELKIPVGKRDRLLLVANGSTVYWIEGIGVSQQAALKDTESGYFKIEVEENEQ